MVSEIEKVAREDRRTLGRVSGPPLRRTSAEAEDEGPTESNYTRHAPRLFDFCRILANITRRIGRRTTFIKRRARAGDDSISGCQGFLARTLLVDQIDPGDVRGINPTIPIFPTACSAELSEESRDEFDLVVLLVSRLLSSMNF